ncbi:hypothetical protein EXN61_10230 [Agrobacterium tumefaciens]|uniref:Uncharacterized protein n=1 Tax=Agrobacterium tumefaciens TaxID=358 RepID=A0A546Y3C1_AGRTU|nr:hypothetical protein [Agrobacterium tumefaciens]TRB07473.1 hypothetical protein EXN61_10230 [Agrobacterium tumefaciens]
MLRKIIRRPKYLRSGELAYVLPHSYVKERHELLLTVSLVTNRYLFGLVYSGLCPQYFRSMGEGSGVFVSLVVPTDELNLGISKPGDIDILVIPYQDNALILDQILAIEVKVVRASFFNQGRSPNSMGMTQADGLLKMGFPYVAVAHLIVSDESPEHAWRPMGIAEILDEFGNCRMLPEMNVDWMPIDLMERAMGKMKSARSSKNLGLAAAFLASREEDLNGAGLRGTWYPNVEPASVNDFVQRSTLEKIVSLFHENPTAFMDIPRYDP